MKILVIGKNGFIGKSIIEYFYSKNDFIITGTSSDELDLLDETAVYKFLKKGYFDIVINTAIFTKSKHLLKSANNELEYDLRTFFNLAKYNYLYGKMIYFGSGAEYNKEFPICSVTEEEWIHMIPSTDYGFAKYIMNQYAEKSENIYNLRVFGIYGKNEDYRRKFITGSCAKAVCNLPITIRQNVLFDYLYIDDFCQIIEKFLILEKPQYHSYNLSSGRQIDLLTLAQLVKKVSKKNIPIIVCKNGLAKEYTADNQRLLKEIGAIKLTDFEETIRTLYDYFSNIKEEIDITPLIYQG